MFKIVENEIDSSEVDAARFGAERLLKLGIDAGVHDHFEPWDSYLFLAGPTIKRSLEPISHIPYINLFLLGFDGDFLNTSPHGWMDEVIRRIYLNWNPPS